MSILLAVVAPILIAGLSTQMQQSKAWGPWLTGTREEEDSKEEAESEGGA